MSFFRRLFARSERPAVVAAVPVSKDGVELARRVRRLAPETARELVRPVPHELRLNKADLKSMSRGGLPRLIRESVVRAWGPPSLTLSSAETLPLPDMSETDGMKPEERDAAYRALNDQMMMAAQRYLESLSNGSSNGQPVQAKQDAKAEPRDGQRRFDADGHEDERTS